VTYRKTAVNNAARAQEREELLDQLEKRPDAQWKPGALWTFK
jgi:hypothetical protein